jgi:hypothetical protein
VAVELLQGPVVGHHDVTVLRTEGDGRGLADAVVGDPDDEVHEVLPPARLDLLDAPDPLR